jgi:DedD protein
MAFFKFRKNADDPVSAPAQPQSIESLRQRAKYRLVGATVLVLIGVIGLPLLFDKQPRPIAVDTPIEIPDKNKVLPLQIPASPAPVPATGSASAMPAVALAASAPDNAVPDKPVSPVAASSAVAKESDKKVALAPGDKASDATKSVEKVDAKEAKAAKPAVSQASAAASKATDANRAQSLLEGKEPDVKASAKAPAKTPTTTPVVPAKTPAVSASVPAAATSAAKPAAAGAERYVVQVGAFAENTRAREVRLKVESVGLKTYAQVAETKDGRRIRVRVGPFATKAEAEKAAEKIKKLQLPAALLTL